MTQANYSPENISDDEQSPSLRRKARNNFNYIQLALNAIQSWIAKALEEIKASIIKPAIRGGFAINDVRYYGILANAIATLPSGSAQTLYITNTQVLSADLTIPSNISIVILKGGSIGGAHTLTVNGPFEAGVFQVFDSSISVVFGVNAPKRFHPQWWGADPTGTVDSYAALNKASTASASVSGEVMVSPGTFLTSQPWNIPSNIIVRGSGNGSVIKAMSSFTGDGWSGVVTFRYTSENSTLRDIKIDGNKAQVPTSTDYLGISLIGCANISLENVTGVNVNQTVGGSGGDGIYIGSDPNNSFATVARNIHMYGCTFDANVRQGMSIVAGQNIAVYGSTFTGTTGSNPGAGLDIEPNTNTATIKDVYFNGCSFSYNLRGIAIYNGNQSPNLANIVFESCDINNNTDEGVSFTYAFGNTRLLDCSVRSNSQRGVYLISCLDATIEGCRIYDNHFSGIELDSGNHGVQILGNSIVLNWLDGIKIAYTFGGAPKHRIAGNYIFNNSNHNATTYSGVHFLGNGSHPDFSTLVTGNFIGNDSALAEGAGATQKYGIRIDANTQHLTITGNSFADNVTDPILNSGSDNIIELNISQGYAYSSAANAIGSRGLTVNGPLTLNTDFDNLKITSYLGIGVAGDASRPLLVQGVIPGTAAAQEGIEVSATFNSHATTSGYAGVFQARTDAAAFTMTSAAALRAVNASIGSGSTITTQYGLLVDSISGAGTNYAIKTSTGLVDLGDRVIIRNGLFVLEGTNATMGVATLVAGSATVSTTKVTASSRILLTSQADGGTVGFLRVSGRTASTSFTITSSSVTDTSTVAWVILEPA